MMSNTAITHFHTMGSKVRVVRQPLTDPITTLPPAIYIIKYDQMSGFFLEEHAKKFTLPSKTFGDFITRTDKVINTYNERPGSTGVILTGTKGAGKSVQCKALSNKMLEAGISTILVQDTFKGTEFNEIIDSIGECVVFFDEIGKVYKNEHHEQDDLLTLLDGTSSNKRLVIATENRKVLINDFMFDRPGRFFYHFEYDGLEENTIREFCGYYGLDEKRISQVVSISTNISAMTFDILGGMVEEMLRYNYSAEEACNDMNIVISDYSTQTVDLVKCVRKSDNKEFTLKTERNTASPSQGALNIQVKLNPKDEAWFKIKAREMHNDKEEEWSEDDWAKWDSIETANIRWSPATLRKFTDGVAVHDNGTFVFSLQTVDHIFDYRAF